MNLIFLGPPGAGKGTQSAHVAAKYRLVSLSTGDMLRAAVAEGTELGRKAQAIMQGGGLVPDEVVAGLIGEALQGAEARERGFILDGFPRNLAQARMLEGILREAGVALDLVVELRLGDEVLAERIAARNAANPSARRQDDTPETLRRRIAVYHEETTPLSSYYRDQGLLREIDGSLSVEQVSAAIEAALDSFAAGSPRPGSGA